MALRTRISPAPTGYLHLGGARTALFNWFMARQSGGVMLLRIEDTNAELYRPEYVDSMLRTFEWLGIGFDEEPVFQSRRAERYAEATEKLLAAGAAYRCNCTIDEVKARAAARGDKTPGYDGFCRDRDLPAGPGAAVRFRVPHEGETEFDDVVRGHVSFVNAALEDFVIQRANGAATFFLPNAVDDVDMEITHVVRGEDLINVTPRVLLIREALGLLERPVFAHLPMLVNAQRKKLSKRRDDVSVEDFRDRGYMSEAMCNYLAVLGWGPPDGVEIRPIDEFVELFRLEDVNQAGAFFDIKKLDHVNGEYIRALPLEEFVERAAPFVSHPVDDRFVQMAPELQTRLRTLAEVEELVGFFYVDAVDVDEGDADKGIRGVGGPEIASAILDAAIAQFGDCTWDHDTLHDVTLRIGEGHGLALGKAQAPIRVAVTGRRVGPPLFESLEVLGREATLERLRRFRERLGP